MRIRHILIALWISFGGVTACSGPDVFGPPDYGYNYFPLSIGDYREYKVLEVEFNAQVPDSSEYFLKEEIVDSIVSTQYVTYLIKRSKRNSVEEAWVADSLWTTRRTESDAIVVENNVPFRKISFPVLDGRKFDGNAFNTLLFSQYQMDLEIVDTTDAEALKIIISDVPENIVSRDQRSEWFMKGIGLVQKDYITLKFCTTDCPGVGIIESGRVLNQKLLNYAVE